METERITEFKKGTNLFHSTGISVVKVTRVGEIVRLEVPIQATGISDLVDTFNDNAPQPPMKNYKADPNDPNDQIAKDYGISSKQWIKIPDYSDSDYIKKTNEHSQDLGIAITMKGIAVEFKDEEGNVIENKEEKLELMKGMGMSHTQLQQIAEDILNLTQWSEEEKETFLGEK